MQSTKGLPAPDPPENWLWQGFLKRGTITLLTSRSPSGKTQLVEQLLAATESGGVLAGRPVAAAPAILLKNPFYKSWEESLHPVVYAPHVAHIQYPFIRPMCDEWPDFITEIADVEPALFVIDPFEEFLSYEALAHAPELENSIDMLRLLSAQGWTVVLVNRRCTVYSKYSLAPTLNPVLARKVDAVLRLERFPGTDRSDPRRTLRFRHRHRGVTITLTATGSHEEPICPDASDPFECAWMKLKALFPTKDTSLNRNEILESWPQGNRPSARTISRMLDRAVQEGKLVIRGTGHRGDPRRYSIA